jgi:hypothetical protein
MRAGVCGSQATQLPPGWWGACMGARWLGVRTTAQRAQACSNDSWAVRLYLSDCEACRKPNDESEGSDVRRLYARGCSPNCGAHACLVAWWLGVRMAAG